MSTPTAEFRDGTKVERRCPHCGRFVSGALITREDYGHPTVYCWQSKEFYPAKILVKGSGSPLLVDQREAPNT